MFVFVCVCVIVRVCVCGGGGGGRGTYLQPVHMCVRVHVPVCACMYEYTHGVLFIHKHVLESKGGIYLSSNTKVYAPRLDYVTRAYYLF